MCSYTLDSEYLGPLLLTWMNFYTSMDEITYPFLNFNGKFVNG